tara:strand:+ start:2385 stop:3074 length:690 start_codon:yes stop_codon:yes gene_type:complete
MEQRLYQKHILKTHFKNSLMTKLILFSVFFVCSIIYSQEPVNVVTTPNLDDISSMEQTIVHYTKELIEGSKIVGSQAIDLVEQGVDVLFTEGYQIVKQYLIFTAISYGIPVLIGIYLVFFLTRRLYNNFSINKEEGEEHNNPDTDTAEPSEQIKKGWQERLVDNNKYMLFFGRYYRNIFHLIYSYVFTLTPLIIGIILLANNLLIFIKVSAFPKLYLAELLMKYLNINV